MTRSLCSADLKVRRYEVRRYEVPGYVALAFAAMLLAAPAAAGSTFRLELGPAVAANEPNMKKGTAFVVRGLACPEPARIRVSAVVDTLVGGTRQSTTLDLMPLTASGAYAIPWTWREGAAVVSLIGTCGAETAGAVVPIGQKGFVRETTKVLDHAPSKAEVDRALGVAGAR